MTEINTSNIPEELKSESFMLWRLEQCEGRQTKPPINPSSGYKGNVQDPKQWTDFANALKIHKGGRFHTNGIGVVLHLDSELVGLDLDKCINEGDFSDDVIHLQSSSFDHMLNQSVKQSIKQGG